MTTVRKSITLTEEQEIAADDIRAALVAGEASGPPEPFDLAAFKECKVAEHGFIIGRAESD